MKIGIDIDGTMNNLDKVLKPLLEQQYGIKPQYDKYELFTGMTKEQIEEFEINNKRAFVYDVKPLDDVQDIIHRLSNKRHVIFIITARNFNKYYKTTLEWLSLNNFFIDDFHSLSFDNHDKVKTCIKEKIDIMIEDCPMHLHDLYLNKIKTIKMNHPYNTDSLSTYEANNWKEIYEIIERVI